MLLRRLPRLILRAKPLVAAVRPGEQVLVNGKPERRNPLQMIIRARVVPLTGRQQLILPEGDRKTERYTVYQDPRQTRWVGDPPVDEKGGTLCIGDYVHVYGSACVIEQSKNWLNRYVEAQAVRIDVSTSKKIDFPEVPTRAD
jgi:hypothetical protein